MILGHALGDAYGEAVSTDLPFDAALHTTDDTAQMLCVAKSLIKLGKIDTMDIAGRFVHWAEVDGEGIGRLTRSVLTDPQYLTDPASTAHRHWLKSDQKTAPNGALMRTSVLAVCGAKCKKNLRQGTVDVCTLTHSDPRCIGSCVVMTDALFSLLNGAPSHKAIQKALELAPGYSDEIVPYVLPRMKNAISDIALDTPASQGYTLKTLSAGLWALKNSVSYMHGVEMIAQAGGDADTNSSVAGALLGAKFGISDIPEEQLERLHSRKKLEKVAAELFSVFGT